MKYLKIILALILITNEMQAQKIENFTILLNENGEEVFRYIGKNNSDRFSFDQLKAKIIELTTH